MTKLRIVLDVEPSVFFDKVALINDGGASVGQRMVGAMLMGRVSLADAIGLGLYGINVASIEKGGEGDSEEAGGVVEGGDQTEGG